MVEFISAKDSPQMHVNKTEFKEVIYSGNLSLKAWSPSAEYATFSERDDNNVEYIMSSRQVCSHISRKIL